MMKIIAQWLKNVEAPFFLSPCPESTPPEPLFPLKQKALLIGITHTSPTGKNLSKKSKISISVAKKIRKASVSSLSVSVDPPFSWQSSFTTGRVLRTVRRIVQSIGVRVGSRNEDDLEPMLREKESDSRSLATVVEHRKTSVRLQWGRSSSYILPRNRME